jgi:hypothetical protein
VSLLKFLRIAALFVVLVFVAGVTLQDARESTSWDAPLRVTVYPVNADGRPATAAFLAALDDPHFEGVEDFFAREAGRYSIGLELPVDLRLGEPVTGLPPAPPVGGSGLAVAVWSLHLRAWAWWTLRDQPGPRPQVRLFALFHDPANSRAVPDSLGLRKGLIGVAHGFADDRLKGTNGVVLAHELLHTLGATDKYDPATNLPVWPDGYAEPAREPLLPQRRAEIMAGRVPVGPEEAVLPEGLREVAVGPVTAREIRWMD